MTNIEDLYISMRFIYNHLLKMKTLIVYATKHGSSEKAANMLKEKLKGELAVHNIAKKGLPNINNFDAIIVGGSIHAGMIQKKIKHFCNDNSEHLQKVHLGLYLCCMYKEEAQMQFDSAYSQELRDSALINGLFGGEFLFGKMNWFERSIVKKVVGINKSLSNIDHGAIDRFAEKFNLLPSQ